MSPDTRHRYLQSPRVFAWVYLVAIIGLTLQQYLAPQRAGNLALLQVAAPYLFLPLLALAPIVFWRGPGTLRVAIAACCLLWIMRFGPRPPGPAAQATPAAVSLAVMTWNVDYQNPRPDAIRQALLVTPARVVALQEAYADQIARDSAIAERFPYQLPAGPATGSGTVLLSAYPFLATGPMYRDYPQVLWARLDLGQGRTITVVTAHPLPALFSGCERRRLFCYRTSERDDELREVRRSVAPLLAAGGPLLLMGDFNVTDREPAYRELTPGLQDTALRAGTGLGTTWMPPLALGLRFPLLRIDYLLSSPGVRVVHTVVDCAPQGSDHCSLEGQFQIG